MQPVTVKITMGDEPRPGIAVYFQNPDSSLVSAATTDANGVASALMERGGYVTAIQPFEFPAGISTSELYTYAGVKPGDQLAFHVEGWRPYVGVDLRVPLESTASRYYLHSACDNSWWDITNSGGSGSGSGTPGGPMSMPECASTDLLLETSGSENKYLYAPGVAITEGATIDLTSSTYKAIPEAALSYSGVPSGFTTVYGYTALLAAGGQQSLFGQNFGIDVVNGTATTTVQRPDIPGGRMFVATDLFNGSYGNHGVLEWGPVGDYTTSLDGLLLPEFSDRAIYDAADHALSWTTAAASATPDLVDAVIYFTRSEPLLSWRWQIVGPHTGNSVTYPVLPGDAAQFNPVDSDAAGHDRLYVAKVPGGYDAVRASYFRGELQGLMAKPSGRVVYEYMRIGGKSREGRPANVHRPFSIARAAR